MPVITRSPMRSTLTRAVESDLDRRVACHETGCGSDGAAVVGLADRRQSQHACVRQARRSARRPTCRPRPPAPAASRARATKPSRRSTDPSGCAPGSVASSAMPSPIPPGPNCSVASSGTSDTTSSPIRRSMSSAARCGTGTGSDPGLGTMATMLPVIVGPPRSRPASSYLEHEAACSCRQLRAPADRAGEGVALATAHGCDHADIGRTLGEQRWHRREPHRERRQPPVGDGAANA